MGFLNGLGALSAAGVKKLKCFFGCGFAALCSLWLFKKMSLNANDPMNKALS
jgi:hypothetical protein